jgi:hypothetical protein
VLLVLNYSRIVGCIGVNVGDITISSPKHILGIEPITDEQPNKNLDPQNAPTLPYT